MHSSDIRFRIDFEFKVQLLSFRFRATVWGLGLKLLVAHSFRAMLSHIPHTDIMGTILPKTGLIKSL